MAHEVALAVVNDLQNQMAGLARSVADALSDRKVSAFEGMLIAMKGASLASYIITVFTGMDAVTRDDILYVLEAGDIVVPG